MAKKVASAKVEKPKKAKVKKPPTKAELLQEADELLTRIEAKVEEQKQARYRVDSAREEYKAAKGDLMMRTSELERLANARKEKHPLFEMPKEPEKKKAEQPLLDAEWKSKLLADAGINGDSGEILNEAGIMTIGQLQAHVEEHKEKWAERITGLDDGYATAIVEQLDEFWKANPQYRCEPNPKAKADDDSWKLQKTSALQPYMTDKAWDALDGSTVHTLGDLQERMTRDGDFWHKNIGIHGRFKIMIEDAFNKFHIQNSSTQQVA